MEDVIELAGCVIRDDYGRILLLHRNLGETGLWELPGGKVEEDEEPAVTAVREIREELGVSVQLTKALGDAVFEHNETTYKFYWFQAKVLEGQPSVVETELFDDLDYVEIEEMPGMALSANMEVLERKLISGEVVLDL